MKRKAAWVMAYIVWPKGPHKRFGLVFAGGIALTQGELWSNYASYSELFWRTVLTLILILALLFAYIAATHILRVITTLLYILLKQQAFVVGGIVTVLVGVTLFVASLLVGPGGVPESPHTRGGIALFTAPAVEHVQATLVPLPDQPGPADRFMELDATVKTKTRAFSFAVVGSGSAALDKVALLSGVRGLSRTRLDEDPDGERREVFHIEIGLERSSAAEMLPLSKGEVADDGVAISRNPGGPTVDTDWFDPDTASSFVMPFELAAPHAAEGETIEITLRFLLRLAPGRSASLAQGDLGQVGCAHDLAERVSSYGDADNPSGYFRIDHAAENSFSVPKKCSVDVVIAEVSNATVVKNGASHVVTSSERVSFEGESGLKPEVEDLVSRSTSLTIDALKWRILDADFGRTEAERQRLSDVVLLPASITLILTGITLLVQRSYPFWRGPLVRRLRKLSD